jgi:ectoine hydroxylase
MLMFECNLLHGSAGNISPWPRSNVFFVYNAVSNRPTEPFAAVAPRPAFVGERQTQPIEPIENPNYAALAAGAAS